MQKIVIIAVALALVVPFGAFGVNSLLGGDQDPTSWSDAQYPRPEIAEPELPAPVLEQSETGARETVEHLLGSYTYMMTTGDTAAWDEVVDPNCSVCVQFMANAEQLHSQGGYLVEGEFTVESTTFDGTGEPPVTGTVSARFTQAPSLIFEEAEGEAYPLEGVSGQLDASVAWDGERWRVTDMTLQPDADAAASDAGGASDQGGA